MARIVSTTLAVAMVATLLASAPAGADEQDGDEPATHDGTTPIEVPSTPPEQEDVTDPPTDEPADPAAPAEDEVGEPPEEDAGAPEDEPVDEPTAPAEVPAIEAEELPAAPTQAAAEPGAVGAVEAGAVQEATAAAAAAQLTIVVLMIDITEQARRGDPACGDQNGDGLAQVLDCEIAAALAVVHALASPDVLFALLFLAEQPFFANFAIGRSTDPFVSIDDDRDQDGVPDIIEALEHLGSEWEPAAPPTNGALPDIPAALDLLADLVAYVRGEGTQPNLTAPFSVDGGAQADWRAFLFSPGASAAGPADLGSGDGESTLDGALRRLAALGVEVNTFPAGSASTGCGGSMLGEVADRTGGSCRQISSAAAARCEARSVALGSAGCGSASLPRTGSEVAVPLQVGAVLVAVGLVLIVLARRRRSLVGTAPVGSVTIGP